MMYSKQAVQEPNSAICQYVILLLLSELDLPNQHS